MDVSCLINIYLNIHICVYFRRLDDVAECLQQRGERMDDQASRAALHIAIANFREACPSREKPDLERLPQMALSWRSAWHMSRAIEVAEGTAACRESLCFVLLLMN